MDGEFVELKDGSVRIKKDDGQITGIPLDKLSDVDQRYVRSKDHARGHALALRRDDPDSDGDGLPDFQEIHKYLTDPNNKDTDGSGGSDGDWKQRREHAYSVRAVIRVMPPYNVEAMTDDYQDVRVLSENPRYGELEVVVYPFNTNADAITSTKNWKKAAAGMKEYLAPGVTTNWDKTMRKNLLRELAKDDIRPDELTDREVVEQVSRWILKRSKYYNKMFCTFYVGFLNGNPIVLPGLEKAFERGRGDPQWTVQDEFDHELFGKGMFENKTCGSCTSFATLETTVLRAVGIPTRMILCIPLGDGSDAEQVAMIDKRLTHNQARCDICMGVLAGRHGFANHTFCEVFVGGRWRRLNYSELGQNALDSHQLGLMIKVHAFNDLSEANFAPTWGTRYAKGIRDEIFRHSNPYCLVEVSDHFGQYAKVANPPTANEHKQVTLEKAYWPQSDEAPQLVRESKASMRPGAARFFVHCREWFDNASNQYTLFMSRADNDFLLQADGYPDVQCHLSTSSFTWASHNLRELEVVISPPEYAKMAPGVAYTLHPVNAAKGYVWNVVEGLTIVRDKDA